MLPNPTPPAARPANQQSSSLSTDDLLAQAKWLRRLVFRIVEDADEAEDVVQESLTTALERPPRNSLQLKDWLRTVAKNVVRSRRRRSLRRLARESKVARGESLPSASEVAGRLQTERTVVDALLGLDEPYRSTLVWRFWEDLPPRVIAERLGVPSATIRARLHRGLQLLRGQLESRLGDDDVRPALLPLIGITKAGSVVLPASMGVLTLGSKALSAGVVMVLLVGAVLFFDRATPDPATEVPQSAVGAPSAHDLNPIEGEAPKEPPPDVRPSARESAEADGLDAAIETSAAAAAHRGVVSVRVFLPGRMDPPEDARVALFAPADTVDPRLAAIQDGDALFVGVPTGVTVRAALLLGGDEYYDDEATAGVEQWNDNRLNLFISPLRKAITGRIVLADGTPQRNARVLARMHFPDTTVRFSASVGGRRDRPLVTDDDARFELPVRGDWEAGTRRRLRLVVLNTAGGSVVLPFAAADIDMSRSLDAGQTSIGDVVVTASPVLAAGRVIDEAGRPIAGVEIEVSNPGYEEPGRDWMTRQFALGATTDDRGRFVIVDDPVGGSDITVCAAAEGRVDARVFTRSGDSNIELRMSRGGKVVGQLLLEAEVDPTKFMVRYETDWKNERVKPDADGRFEIPGLEGDVLFRLTVWGVGRECATLERVPIDRLGNQSPVVIDLRDQFHLFRVRALDGHGDALGRELLNVVSLDQPGVFAQAESQYDGKCDVLLPNSVRQVRVSSYERRGVDIAWSRERQDVELGEPLRATFQVQDELPVVSAPWSIQLSLTPLGVGGAELGATAARQAKLSEGGRCEVTLEASGLYRVVAMVWKQGGSDAMGSPATPPTELRIEIPSTITPTDVRPIHLGHEVVERIRELIR